MIAVPPLPASHDGRLDILDVLRIAAALGVIVFHAANTSGVSTVLPDFTIGGYVFHGLRTPLGLGATGVNLFFVLSGFVLTRQWWLAGGIRPAVFVRNRVARIVPAYEAAIIISVIVGLLVNGFEWGFLAPQAAIHAVFAQGFHPRTFLAFNPPLWSMATEVQFYAVFLIAAAWLRRTGWMPFLFWSAVVTLAFRVAAGWFPAAPGSATVTSLIRYQLPGRFFEFALGMALAASVMGATDKHLVMSRCRLAFAVLVFPALAIRWLGPVALADPMMGIVYAAACGALLSTQAPRSWPPAIWRSITLLGRASYSIFLIHDPILTTIAAFWRRYLPDGLPLFAGLIASVPLVIAAGLALYYAVERPMWRRLHVTPTA